MDKFNIKNFLVENKLTHNSRHAEDEVDESIDFVETDRIEGLLNQPMKKAFLEAGKKLIEDLMEEDPFHLEDVILYLGDQLSDYYDSDKNPEDRLSDTSLEE